MFEGKEIYSLEKWNDMSLSYYENVKYI